MTGYSRKVRELVNPVKLADDTVLALSMIERGTKVPPEELNKGIVLCNYLMKLFDEESEHEIEAQSKLIFRSISDDKKALMKSGIDVDTLKKLKSWINDLIKDTTSHTPDEIRELQKLLIDATMRMWQNRTIEFREKKLRRRFIVSG